MDVNSENHATRLLLDPWSTEYPVSVQAENEGPEESTIQIETAVETANWTAQPAGPPPDTAAFIDGVRRLEARLIGMRAEGIVHGLFASFATGAVVVKSGAASFVECRATRRLILTSGLIRSETMRAGNTDLVFEGRAVAANNPSDLVLGLQNAMREAEWMLARSLSAPIIFLDGPLAYVTEPPGPVVGVVKTIHRLYLDPEHMRLAIELRTGERTPVFAIREGEKTRYSCYLRIAERRPIHHGFSGVIRLEASAAAGIDAAVALAGMSAGWLPRFASSANRDPRAPQNLTPVGALEQHLRNQMGDATIIQRAIERRISEGLLL